MPARTRKPASPARETSQLPLASIACEQDWLTIEVDQAALSRNIAVFRNLVDAQSKLLAVVKADAYGHGLSIAAEAFLAGGADLLGVHSISEAVSLREQEFKEPILVLGPVSAAEVVIASQMDLEITVGSLAALNAAVQSGVELKFHLKVETGVNRQGIVEDEVTRVLEILAQSPEVQLVGISSHFADIEDTTDHGFARQQMYRFEQYRQQFVDAGHADLVLHMSCSAAALLWDRSHRSIARVGIAAYGVWPSRETLVSVRQKGRTEVALESALTWKCRISQVRNVPEGETVGYGRTWKAMTDSKIAVLPVGYSDGWPRALSDRGYVLVGGRRAPLVGRICMNLCMVDVTHIPSVEAGDTAVLLGSQGDEVITPEMLATLLGTIAYEVLVLPGPSWRKVIV